MIKVDNGKITMHGTGEDMLTDLACVIHAIYESMTEVASEKIAKETLNEVLKVATMNEEELTNEVTKAFQKGVTSTFLKAMLGL